jgi:hypothetical protein
MLDATRLTTRELIAAYADILDELTARGLRRTSGPLIGELAERLALEVYGGELLIPGSASSDLIDVSGRRVQVKARQLPAGAQRPISFHDLDFDVAVALRFARETGELEWAREISQSEAQAIAAPHAKGPRISTARAAKAGIDVTDRFRAAYEALR